MKHVAYIFQFLLITLTGCIVSMSAIDGSNFPEEAKIILQAICGMGSSTIASKLMQITDKDK